MSAQRISHALRQQVAEQARYRCGYCLAAQRVIGPLLEIDHIIPEARGGTSAEENLWLACPLCNGHKADRQSAIDPESGDRAALFNPRTESWREHFAWSEDGSVILGLTVRGRATVTALCMNQPEVVAARRLWIAAGWHPPAD